MSSSAEEQKKPFTPTVLAFHKLTPEFSYGSTNYTPKKFEKLLNHLTDSGFSFISISELETAGERDILITFDDGYQHLCDYLPSLMETFNFKPVIFIPTAYIGQINSWDYSSYFKKEYHFSIAQMKELQSLGISFGSHGHSHTDLTQLTQVQLADELAKSKSILEDIFNTEITTISYPFGRYNNQLIDYVKFSNYEFGFTMKFPEKQNTLFDIGRIAVYGFDTVNNIMRRINHKQLYAYEKLKCKLINKLSYGTTILNKFKN